jgi:aspartyl-tRNA(Asn)/glutamyl-tRNA(Gln) amidotransferase subunit C
VQNASICTEFKQGVDFFDYSMRIQSLPLTTPLKQSTICLGTEKSPAKMLKSNQAKERVCFYREEDKMSEQITPEVFEHMVTLAALELTPDEAEYLRRELNHQLQAIHELEQVPLDESTPIASHGVPYTAEISQRLRRDDWQPDLAAADIIAQAPETEDGFVVVPDIPHTELS